ncbi:MAG: class I SAM-dependent methyltransferase [Acidimicrobiia bacterium]|nr:class I SAM-dependent methyltransferase [Acidimicrobiia bacterium]
MDFANVYEDRTRALSYASLEFPNTYYLAFRDLPEILRRRAVGRAALDFGCGTGRSTRFLKRLGFEAIGVDLAPAMLALAREADPGGDYRLVGDDGPTGFPEASFDLVLAAFTFDNVPGPETKVRLLTALRRLLRPAGILVNLVSSPDIYRNEWASFSTRDFPENHLARDGDRVRIVMTDVPDRRPVEDVLWSHEAYLASYSAAGLAVLETHWPLGRTDEPYPWVAETRIAPWVIYVAGAGDGGTRVHEPTSPGR